MDEAIAIVAIVIGIPLLIPIVAMLIKHREKMMELQSRSAAPSPDMEKLRAEYQEFLLGVDARFQRLENRLHSIESKIQDTGESDVQQIRRM